MKKTILFGLVSCSLFMLGCSNQKPVIENNDYNFKNDNYNYEDELIVQGVGPEISFEPTVDEGTLVLRKTFEDHSDHVFLNKGIWEEYLKDDSDILPGNTVKFIGNVEYLDGAAGNHYYNVENIGELEVIGYPDSYDIGEILYSYNYCESDSDCGYFVGECPFGCFVTVNTKFLDISSKIINNYFNMERAERCVYSCVNYDTISCENNTCIMKWGENEKDLVFCTPEQKNSDICTMEYAPVCGSDLKTYGNSCTACHSETVESYTEGEC